jgi:type II secretory pathway pseudopilin PulG
VAVVAGIAGGLLIIGSPEQIRMRRLDEQRITDLQSISRAVEDYRRTHNRLPETLEILQKRDPQIFLSLQDRASGQPYAYAAIGESSYQLCAQFDTVFDEKTENSRFLPPFWKHEPGRHCFSFEVRSDVPPQR